MTAPIAPDTFTARLDALLAEALRRHGILGNIAWGTDEWHPLIGLYVGLGVPTDARNNLRGTLADAHCPTCIAPMIVVDPREEQYDVFAYTGADAETKTYATGTLRCGADSAHESHAVHLNSTLGEALHYINDIAEEWGW